MRKLLIFILLSLASMADSIMESVLDRLTWSDLIALGILFFAGLFIFTANNAQTRKSREQ
jgi:hypothetical protein